MDAATVILIYGFILFVMSLKFLRDPKSYSHVMKDVTGSHGLVMITGILPLIFGTLTLVVFGPGYTTGHTTLLAAVLGLIFVLVGIYRILFTESYIKLVKDSDAGKGVPVHTSIVFIASILLMLIGVGTIPLN